MIISRWKLTPMRIFVKSSQELEELFSRDTQFLLYLSYFSEHFCKKYPSSLSAWTRICSDLEPSSLNITAMPSWLSNTGATADECSASSATRSWTTSNMFSSWKRKSQIKNFNDKTRHNGRQIFFWLTSKYFWLCRQGCKFQDIYVGRSIWMTGKKQCRVKINELFNFWR